MAREIDERVVSLEFENRNFEKNAKESLSTIEKIKKALNFDGVGKGINDVERTMNKMDFNPIANGVETVKVKFSTMEALAMNALLTIESQAIRTGERLIQSLSTDQISAGWNKYAEKTSAVQTIMAATSKDFEDAGVQMAYVNDQLDKLNWFTDETSYNFLDMVNNIGKFTSNQIPLADSVTAMQGISNWAARSGANIGEAGRAMYNLSQAIAVGSVKLMDWKSIENANMATAEFKQTAIETAIALGTLKENADGTISTLANHDVSIQNFNENLKDEWFSSEVLLQTLDKYGGFTDKLYEFINSANNEDVLVSQVLRFVDDFKNGVLDINDAIEVTGLGKEEITEWMTLLSDDSYDLGRKALEAAQMAKTFGEAVDATKDAVSTGWMNTFEIIFGDFEHAKVLWTDLANSLYDIFALGGSERNNLLKNVFGSNLDKFKQELTSAGSSMDEFSRSVERVLQNRSHGQSLQSLVNIYGSMENAIASDAISVDVLREAMGNLTKTTADLSEVTPELNFGSTGEDVKQIQQALADLGYTFEQFGVDGIIGSETTEAIKAFQEANGLTINGFIDNATLSKLKELTTETIEFSEATDDLLGQLSKTGGYELFWEGMYNIGGSIYDAFFAIKEGWNEVFSIDADRLYSLIESFRDFSKSLVLTEEGSERLKDITSGLASILHIGVSAFTAVGKAAINVISLLKPFAGSAIELTALFAKWITNIDRFITENDIFGNAIVKTTNYIKNLYSSFADFVRTSPAVQRIINALQVIFSKFGVTLKYLNARLKPLESLNNLLAKFKTSISGFGNFSAEKVLEKVANWLERISRLNFTRSAFHMLDYLSALKDRFINFIKGLNFGGSDLSGFSFNLDFIKIKLSTFKDAVVNGLDGFGDFLSSFWTKFTDFLGSFNWGAIIAITTAGTIIYTILSAAKAVRTFAGAGTAIKDFFVSLRKGFQQDDNVGDIAFKIAEAIALIAGSLAVLVFIPQNKLWSSVGAITVLSLVLVGLSGLLGLLQKKELIGDISKVSSGLLALSASVLILSFAADKLSKISVGGLIKAGFAITSFLLGLVASSMRMSKYSKDFGKNAVFILAFAVFVKILTDAAEKLAKIPLTGISKALFAITSFLVVLVSSSVIMSKFAKDFGKNTLGILALVVAMELLIHTVKKLDKLSLNDPIGTITKLVGVIGALTLATYLIRKASGTDGLKAGGGILAIVFSMEIIIDVMKKLGKLNTPELAKGLTGIVIMTSCISALMLFANTLGKGTGANLKGIGIGVLAMSASVLLLTYAMRNLAKMNAAELVETLAAVGILSLIVKSLVKVSGSVGKELKGFIGLAVVIATLTAALAALSLIPGDKLMKSTVALSSVLIALGVTMKLIKFDKSTLTGAIGIGIILLSLTASLSYLQSLDFAELVADATALGGLAIALSTALNALKVLGTGGLAGIGAVAVGIGEFEVFLGVLIATFAGLEALNDKWGVMDIAFKGLNTFAEGIGVALGKLIGGIGVGVTSEAGQIAENLTDFAEKLQPFAEVIGSDQMQSAKAGMDSLTGLIGALVSQSWAEFWQGGIIKMITGHSEDEYGSFGNRLASLAHGLKVFARASNGITEETIEPASKAAELLIELSEKIPKAHGFLQAVEGYPDMATFGNNLKGLGVGLADYANAISPIENLNAVETSASALTILANMADELPKSDSLFDWLTGSVDYEAFGKGMAELGSGIADYCLATKDIDTSNVEVSSKAITLLSKLAKKLPEVNGILSTIFGGQMDMETFGEQLGTFGSGISGYAESIVNVDPGKMNAVSESLALLTATMGGFSSVDIGAANNFSTVLAWLSGTDMATLTGDWAKTFTESLSSLSTEIGTKFWEVVGTGIQNAAATSSFDITESLSTILDGLLGNIGNTQNNFYDEGNSLIAKFIKGMNSKKKSAEQSMSNIVTAVKNRIKNYSLYSNGSSLAQTFVNGVSSKYNSAFTAGGYLVQGVIDGIGNKSSVAGQAAFNFGQGMLQKIQSGMEEHSPSKATDRMGRYLGIGAINGLKAMFGKSEQTGFEYGQMFVNSITDNISSMADAFDGELDFTPRIMPSVNLTEVKNRARQMRSFVDSNRLQATVIANTMSDANGDKMDKLIQSANTLIGLVKNGSDVYLDEKLIVGRMNRRLGAMLG